MHMIGGSGLRIFPFIVLAFPIDAFVVRRADIDADTGPNKYFLTKEELQGVRNGHAREDVRTFSTGNTITYLAPGDKFMRRLHEVLEDTQKGDFIYATFWELNPDVILVPDPSDRKKSETTRLIHVLERAAKRQVQVHILYSGHMLDWTTVDKVCERIDAACGEHTCIPDFRHGHKYTGSNHEKMWMVRRGEGLTAFIGSMDIGNSRWDTATHDITAAAWKMEPLDAARQFAWHGDMFEIVGPAAEDVLGTFYSRWNDDVNPEINIINQTPGFVGRVGDKLGFAADIHRTYPALDLWRPQVAYKGASAAQVVRTFGCGARARGMEHLYAAFAPDGEFSYAGAWFKALREAREYVYVADQFMWFDEALAGVVEAAERVKFVIVVTNTQKMKVTIPPIGDVSVDQYGEIVQDYQYRGLIKALAKKDPTGALAKKVHIFSLVKEGTDGKNPKNQIYDHEKTLIVDDEFALVGSTGVELVGFTNDAELSVGIHDPAFVTDLRKQIFSEFLLTPVDSPRLATADESLQLFLEHAAGAKQRVRFHVPKKMKKKKEKNFILQKVAHANFWKMKKLAKTVYRAIEVDGRCTGDKRKSWDVARNGLVAPQAVESAVSDDEEAASAQQQEGLNA